MENEQLNPVSTEPIQPVVSAVPAPASDWYSHPSYTGQKAHKISASWTIAAIFLKVGWGVLVFILVAGAAVIKVYRAIESVNSSQAPLVTSSKNATPPPSTSISLTPLATPTDVFTYPEYGLEFHLNPAVYTVVDATDSATDTNIQYCVVALELQEAGSCGPSDIPTFSKPGLHEQYRISVRTLEVYPEGGQPVALLKNTGKIYPSTIVVPAAAGKPIRKQIAEFNTPNYSFVIEQFNNAGQEPVNQIIANEDFKKFLQRATFE
jgi:hypothetical protein